MRIYLEFEDMDQPVSAGMLILSGQGRKWPGPPEPAGAIERRPLEAIASPAPGAIVRPGPRRVRALLEAAPENGWADPEIRSIWPGRMQTNWVEVEIVRR